MQVQLLSRSLGYKFSDILPYIETKSPYTLLYTAIPDLLPVNQS